MTGLENFTVIRDWLVKPSLFGALEPHPVFKVLQRILERMGNRVERLRTAIQVEDYDS